MEKERGTATKLALLTEKKLIASRCGVFAKTDIQPLLNQGARKEDVAASIFQAVVDQTVTGLSQGRKIEGKVLFLGGPLFFFQGLQQRFEQTLRLAPGKAVFPEWAQYSVALGAAIYTRGLQTTYTYEQFTEKLKHAASRSKSTQYLQPLFASQEEHDQLIAILGLNLSLVALAFSKALEVLNGNLVVNSNNEGGVAGIN